jgi:hypothetical protein
MFSSLRQGYEDKVIFCLISMVFFAITRFPSSRMAFNA